MHTTRTAALLAAAALAVALTACGGDRPGGPTGPTSPRVHAQLTLIPDVRPLVPSSTLQLVVAHGEPGEGAPPPPPVVWSSSDEAVAVVSDAGVVTGVAPGEAVITAASESDTVRTPVRVYEGGVLADVPTTIVAYAGAITLAAGEGAAPAGTRVTMTATTPNSTESVLLAGSVYEVGPATLALDRAAVLTISYAPWTLPADAWEPSVHVARLTEQGWKVVSGGSADAVTHTASAPIDRGGTYGVLVPPQVVSVRLAPADISVRAGASASLAALALGAGDVEIQGLTAVWSLADSAVVRVSSTGVLTGVRPGRSTVFADLGGQRAQATVTVRPQGPLHLSPRNIEIQLGQLGLGVAAFDRGVWFLSSDWVTWSTSDPTIARAEPTGLVRPRAPGAVWVYGEIDGFRDSMRFVVRGEPVASLSITAPRTKMSVETTLRLALAARDQNGVVLTGRFAEWATSDAAVATVTADGLVAGLTPGKATISATVEGRVASVEISVESGVVGPIVLSPGELTIPQNIAYRIAVYDGRLTLVDGSLVSWSSSDPRIATTLPDGRVVGQARGTVFIRATAGSWRDSMRLTVSGAPRAPLVLSPGLLQMNVGGALRVVAYDGLLSLMPSRDLAWSTSDSRVATVDAEGVVRGLTPGTVYVRADIEGLRDSMVMVVRSPVAFVSIERTDPIIASGRSGCFRATPFDDAFNPAHGQTIAWSTGNTDIATVSTDGVVTGVGVGTTSITASSAGRSASVDVTIVGAPPPPPANLAFANEPAGLALLTDNPWDEMGKQCWQHADRGARSTVAPDATAPRSAGMVLEHQYPTGFVGGNEPAIDQYLFRTQPREVFVGTFVKFSPDWQGHSGGVNKIMNIVSENPAQRLWLVLRAVEERDDNADLSDGPYFVDAVVCGDYRGLPGTNRNAEPVSVGEWHKIEWYVRANSPGQQNGVFRWWVDGVLRGEYTNLDCLGSKLDWLEIAPTFGGVSNTKRHDDYLRFDHVYISGRP